MDKKIYLGSQSQARHSLLRQAEIAFEVVPLSVVEEEAVVSGTIYDHVYALSEYKHEGLMISDIVSRHDRALPALFLTADTLIAGATDGILYGKPKDRAHAHAMLTALSTQDIIVATGMTLSVWRYDAKEGDWYRETHETWIASATARFIVPTGEIDRYLDACPGALKACAATVVEHHGIRYFECMSGSYSGTLGLDVYGLYQRLKAID